MVIKRIFDVCFSIIGIILLSPLFILIALFILIGSGAPVFYVQQRVGRNGVEFSLIKFRTMYMHSEELGALTIGNNDKRITRTGYWLRKYKLDELPQLFNVLIGNMSFVGPRPEVIKYTQQYTPQQLRVLSVKPGITDWASIQYFNENELLANAENPEQVYINEIIPSKIRQSLNYIDHRGFFADIKILYQTLRKVITT